MPTTLEERTDLLRYWIIGHYHPRFDGLTDALRAKHDARWNVETCDVGVAPHE
ncbi:MAG: hypothetical protein ACOCQM_05935 [Natronomonas sp.]